MGGVAHRPVVAAAILDSLESPTRLLCASRAYPAALAGLFELPGGKVEPGESPSGALGREIAEELATSLILGPKVAAPDGGWWPVLEGRRMAVWLARIADGAPAPRRGPSHRELRWVPLDRLDALDWIGADRPIVRAAVRVARTRSASSEAGPGAHGSALGRGRI
jgi:8-oxo-dGTP diphosphatase